MSIGNSELASQIENKVTTESGVTHFLKDLAVIEFNEGVHMNLKSVKPTLKAIKNHYGNSRPFGIIANRINSYSVSLLDLKKARQKLPNLAAYGIVSYNNATRMNAEIESGFCQWNDICFNNLFEGLEAVQKRVLEKQSASLN